MARAVWLAVLLVAATFAVLPSARAVEPAPSFTLTDIDGANVSSGVLLGKVFVLDFSGTTCEPCKIVESGFKDLYPAYQSKVAFLTVFIPPSNDVPSLIAHRDANGVPWHIAADNVGDESLQVKYGVGPIPRIFVINQTGYVTEDWSAPVVGLTEDMVENEIGDALDAALAGTAKPIDITALSIPALLVVAAFLSFFSPCSFPVLPAFMAFYLNLDAKGTKASNRTAAARGFVASLGIVTVYGIIALVVFAVGFAAQALITWLPPIVGVLLIVFGILTVLPFQYYWLTRPFSALKQRIAARLGGKGTTGTGAKLFAFGMGYGAAGFACVAPPFIGAVLNASAIGSPAQAILGLLLYVIIVIALMVAITLSLHVAGDRALQKLKSWSGIVKYVSAVALVVAGVYLLYLFAAANL